MHYDNKIWFSPILTQKEIDELIDSMNKGEHCNYKINPYVNENITERDRLLRALKNEGTGSMLVTVTDEEMANIATDDIDWGEEDGMLLNLHIEMTDEQAEAYKKEQECYASLTPDEAKAHFSRLQEEADRWNKFYEESEHKRNHYNRACYAIWLIRSLTEPLLAHITQYD